MSQPYPAAILLCAGASRRFGAGDKLLVDYGGKPLYRYTFDTVLASGFSRVVAVTDLPDIRALAAEYGFATVSNPDRDRGISTSIRAGILAAGDSQGWAFFVCDQPRLTPATVHKLAAAYRESGQVTVPVHGDRSGNPCFFPPRYRGGLLALRGDSGGKAIIRRLPEGDICRVAIDDPLELWDIDTREDFEPPPQ